MVLESETKVSQGLLPLWAPEEGPSCLCPLLMAPGGPWLVATSLQSLPLPSPGLLLHVTVSLPLLSLTGTLAIGWRDQLHSPSSSYLRDHTEV